ncbi:glycosyltransferase [Microbacterium sp. NPDC076768]|uniref:glycosyltransferase n=1 Tax=Microbacterium sp. NPDC076768 TaxID=3154858 RepID=UPI00344701A0
MSARLRIVLDQVAHTVDADQSAASMSLAAGLVATAPSGCAVDAIVPAGGSVTLAGIKDVRVLGLARRELATSWQLGVTAGVGKGMIHAPTLMAPLVRHDRVHENHQITATVWDLRAWEAPELLPKNVVAWQRAMLKRAAKHADAVVVPSHAVARSLAEVARIGDRVRVIAGAAPQGFTIPPHAAELRAALSLPEEYVVLTGPLESLTEGFRGVVAAGLDAVVLDAPEGSEPRHAEVASAAGLPERRVHVRGYLTEEERAAVLAGSSAFVATSAIAGWPWRAVEAMALGIPVVALNTGSHQDVIADGGLLVASESIAEAIVDAVGGAADRLGVLAADRSRAFSWASSAERVWALHADL